MPASITCLPDASEAVILLSVWLLELCGGLAGQTFFCVIPGGKDIIGFFLEDLLSGVRGVVFVLVECILAGVLQGLL